MRFRIIYKYSVVEMTFLDLDALCDFLIESGREDFILIKRLA